MRILFIAHNFQPEPNFFFGLPLAEELVRRGHSVEVLTGFPSYPQGRIFPGYRQRLWQRETLNGIPVLRVPLYPSHDRSSVKRILSYTSLSSSQAVLGLPQVKKADVAYVVQGPTTVGLPAFACKLLRRIPYVLHIQDLWPDSLLSTGMFSNRLGLWLIHNWCKFTYAQASRVIVISPGVREKLIERNVPRQKVDLVYNWCDEAQICQGTNTAQAKEKFGMAGKFNIVFAGNMGAAQALEDVLNAAAILRDSSPQIRFVLIGGGMEEPRLKEMAKARGLSNVAFYPRQPVSEIGAVLKAADALLLQLRDDPLFRITVPSKTQAYLAMGRPILAAIAGDAAALVQEAKAGLTCEPGNPAALAATARNLSELAAEALDEMGANGSAYYAKNLSVGRGLDRLVKIFKQASQQ